MVRIRLRRVGAKKQPHYRVVVADQRSPRDGRHIETIGFYDPRTEPETVRIAEDRALYWLSAGAQPSEVVQAFLSKQGTLERLNRLQTGEPLEALVAEYEASIASQEEVEPVAAEPVQAEAETEMESEAEAVAEIEGEVETEADEEMAEVEAEADDSEAAAELEEADTEAEETTDES
jgi:small subunit ribosomal protein S16